jgi:hypothetical protein
MQLAVIPVSLNFKRLSFTVEKIGHPLAHGREYSTVLRPFRIFTNIRRDISSFDGDYAIFQIFIDSVTPAMKHLQQNQFAYNSK